MRPTLAFAHFDMEQATVVMDKMTQKSKGYGFVTFKGMDGAHAALENPEKMIDVSIPIDASVYHVPASFGMFQKGNVAIEICTVKGLAWLDYGFPLSPVTPSSCVSTNSS